MWLNSIADVVGHGQPGSMGLSDHLDAAFAQGATYAQFVLHNLPGRDCDHVYSPGELAPDEVDRYRTEYLDPIATIMGDPRYAGLRIIAIIEPRSLARLITNTGDRYRATWMCDTVLATGAYVDGIRAALDTLHAIPNVYTYLDVEQHGDIGWATDFGPVAELMAATVRGTAAGMASVDGVVANTANYGALTEEFFTIDTVVGGRSVRETFWVDWNDYVDVTTFVAAFRQELVRLGFKPDLGVLVDTSRDGWGGPNRPTQRSTSNNPDVFVNESRIDRRIKAEYWCNQSGAGLGERPTVSPRPGIDAYVWIKPPGESDGAGGISLAGMCSPEDWPPGGSHRPVRSRTHRPTEPGSACSSRNSCATPTRRCRRRNSGYARSCRCVAARVVGVRRTRGPSVQRSPSSSVRRRRQQVLP